MRKSHFNDKFLVLLGPIISRFFACSNEEKNKPKQQKVRAVVLSLWLKGLPMTNTLAILSEVSLIKKSFIALTLRLLDFSFSAEIVRHKGAER